MTALALDERHAIGANNPPEESKPEVSPFDAHKANIEDLFLEAKNWIDGAAIETQEQADKVQELLRKMQEAETAADASRALEKKPHDDAANAVQAKYAPLIADTKAMKGKTKLAIPALKAVSAKWLAALETKRLAEVERLRVEAEEAANAARALVEEARETGDLGAAEVAEDAIREASRLDRVATRTENARPQSTGYGRALSLRDRWVIKGFVPVGEGDDAIKGETALLRHYYTTNFPAMVEAALVLARQDIQAGKRTLPGLVIVNEPTAA